MIRTAFLTSSLQDTECSPDIAEVASLVQRVLNGDSAAFECLIRRYERRIARLALKLLGTPEDAQDAAQEVFLRTYKYLHRLDVRKPIEPWLMRMTVNVCRNIGRKRQARFSLFCDSEADLVVDTARDPHADIVEEQEKRLLMKALKSLPEKERIAVTLRDIEGFSTAEVAAIMESSEGTVRSHVSRARVRMKDAVDEMLRSRK
ncbi:MAG TPA: sigma-70 family RNA polymerase sigma factor [Terriglobia bacterium]|nr:sigma-70 family RNA polymerase sigma factor [Terriglobia bacterium]